jgi:hypothetical protein
LASFEKEAARWPGGILSCKPNDGVSSLFDGAISGVIVEVRLRVAGIGGALMTSFARSLARDRLSAFSAVLELLYPRILTAWWGCAGSESHVRDPRPLLTMTTLA